MQVKNGSVSMSDEEIKGILAENARLKEEAENKAHPQVRIQTSPKKGVSVYGLMRFPVTLYPEQWIKLLGEISPQILQYIQDNKDELSWKNKPSG